MSGLYGKYFTLEPTLQLGLSFKVWSCYFVQAGMRHLSIKAEARTTDVHYYNAWLTVFLCKAKP